jgi:hypothetical protein
LRQLRQVLARQKRTLQESLPPALAKSRSEGLEPPTYKFVACCSIQLSYDRAFLRRERDSNPRYDFTSYNGLANRRLQPLGHLSKSPQAFVCGVFRLSLQSNRTAWSDFVTILSRNRRYLRAEQVPRQVAHGRPTATRHGMGIG